MLSYEIRIRDLVHGFVYLTALEVRVINHPLFQRLRYIRQNDVASYVYPSLNISRFEHALGCSSVAHKMATSLMRSPEWINYQKKVNLDPDEFVQVCRLYALLHDVGHLPFSHLFEIAFEDWANVALPNQKLPKICEEWFGGMGFTKLHEACGSVVTNALLDEVNTPAAIKGAVLQLTGRKLLDREYPIRPIKLLIDSEIDADRIDSTARDGLLAGGEYGSYDIERLSSSVFLKHEEEGWCLAYSQKAMSSIEGLLLDRYRTHTWIHFHRGVVAMKVAVGELIERLLAGGIISKESFPINKPRVMALRDDVWLVSLLRQWEPDNDDSAGKAARDFFLYRDKSNVTLLWRNRTEYRTLNDQLIETAQLRDIKDHEQFGRDYEAFITEKLGIKVLVFWVQFRPIGNRRVPLTSEDGSQDLGDVLESSPLLHSLRTVWKGEPAYHVVLLGRLPGSLDEVRSKWIQYTVEWMDQHHVRV